MPRHFSVLFGAVPQGEGFSALLREGERQVALPSESLLSVLRRSRAARLLCLSLCLFLVTGICVFILSEEMGQAITTPLSLSLEHWKEIQEYAHNQSAEVHKKKWVAFCASEWPTFDVGWPRDGTFSLDIIRQVKEKVMDSGPHGHPDQVDYIITWEALVQKPPAWVKPFLSGVVPPSPKSAKPSAPSLPPPLTPLPAPTRSRSALYPALVQASPKAPPLPKPKVLPAGEETLLMDLLSEPPPYQEAPHEAANEAEAMPAERPAATDEAAPSPVASRLRGRREQAPADSTAMPLRTGPDGQLQYWPFSASDLYNWKNNNPPFSKDPLQLISLLESVLVTHQPTWDDCQQLLQVLLTTEEKQRVLLEARKNVRGADGQPTQLPNEIDAAFPLTRPEWDFSTEAGRTHLRLYRQLLIAGLRGAARRPTNLAQVKQVLQRAEETPAAFLERLKEAYRMYTPYDPEDPGQATGLAMAFIWQSAPDIRNKLQRLDNLQGYTVPDLLKEAEKVFNNRESQEEREERWRRENIEREERQRKEMEERENARDKRRQRELSRLMATVVSGQRQRQDRQGGDRRGPRVDKDQCAYCKERGHWARECPKKQSRNRNTRPQASASLLNLED